MTDWKMIGKNWAPVARNASTELLLTSSIVSINARVKKPKEAENKAKNPVMELCPKEKSRINAHAATGILRETVAIPLLIALNNPFTFVVFEPHIAKKVAKIAADVVEATDIKTVSCNLLKISGSFSIAFASGKKFVTPHSTAFATEASPFTS